MLSVSRLIGHKEYAAGRKSDPTYSMDWRRNRVAAFVPRGSVTSKPTPAPKPAPVEDDMFSEADRAALSRIDKVTGIILDDPVIFEGVNLAEAQRRILRGLAGMQAAVNKLADALAAQQGLDPEELKAAVRDAIAESVVQVDVNVSGGGTQPPTPA